MPMDILKKGLLGARAKNLVFPCQCKTRLEPALSKISRSLRSFGMTNEGISNTMVVFKNILLGC